MSLGLPRYGRPVGAETYTQLCQDPPTHRDSPTIPLTIVLPASPALVRSAQVLRVLRSAGQGGDPLALQAFLSTLLLLLAVVPLRVALNKSLPVSSLLHKASRGPLLSVATSPGCG